MPRNCVRLMVLAKSLHRTHSKLAKPRYFSAERSWDFVARFSQRFFTVLWMADIAFRGSYDTRYLVELLLQALSEHVGAVGRSYRSRPGRNGWFSPACCFPYLSALLQQQLELTTRKMGSMVLSKKTRSHPKGPFSKPGGISCHQLRYPK